MASAPPLAAPPLARLRIDRRLAAVGAPVGALALGLLVGALLVVAAGGDPVSAYGALLDGASELLREGTSRYAESGAPRQALERAFGGRPM